MSNKKNVQNFRHNRRTGKAIETIADREKRYNNMLNLLDQKADEILAKRGTKNTAPAPSQSELDELARQNPETAEMLEKLFEIADKMK